MQVFLNRKDNFTLRRMFPDRWYSLSRQGTATTAICLPAFKAYRDRGCAPEASFASQKARSCRILLRASKADQNQQRNHGMTEQPMLTRRNFVAGAIVTGALLRTEAGFPKASQPATAVNFEIPPWPATCHTPFYAAIPKNFPSRPLPLHTEGLPTCKIAAARAPHFAHGARRDRDAERLWAQ